MDNLPINSFICGDCIDVLNNLPEKSVDLIFADPPYNLQIENDLWRPNQTKVEGVSDEWDHFNCFSDYDEFSEKWLLAARRVLKDTGSLVVMGTYHNVFRVGKILQDIGYWFLNDIIWIKDNPLPNMKGTRFCNAHETLLWVAKSKDTKSYKFNYQYLKSLNKDKQMRSDWYFPICQGKERLLTSEGVKAHSTQKPEALLERMILACTYPGDVVLDPFNGSGTTAAVSKKLGRNYIGIDNNPEYISLAEKRLKSIDDSMVKFEDPRDYNTIKLKVPFVKIVDKNMLSVGQELVLFKTDKKSTGFSALIQADGTIKSGELIGSIHSVSSKLLNLPSCNGWTHWYFQSEKTHKLEPINILRTEYAKGD